MRYLCLSPVRFDGRRYLPGENIELPEDVAAQLLGNGVIEPAPGKAKPPKKDPAPEPKKDAEPEPEKDPAPETPAQPTTVAEAIDRLDPENADHWTKTGTPQVPALTALLGRRVTAAERDQAWAALNA